MWNVSFYNIKVRSTSRRDRAIERKRAVSHNMYLTLTGQLSHNKMGEWVGGGQVIIGILHASGECLSGLHPVSDFGQDLPYPDSTW